MTRDDWRRRVVEAELAPRPPQPWGDRPAPAGTVLAWWLALTLRALGFAVAGHGSRLVAEVNGRRATVDALEATWWADGTPVRWGVGVERETETMTDVAVWLADGVVPAQDGEAGVPEVFWGAELPKGRR